ncbi:MAG: YbfB/YjiJ family MFS transporter [Rhodanobacteraceae bacterium]
MYQPLESPASSLPCLPARAHADTPSLWVAVGLSMGTTVAVGLARFAYSLLLPAMRADLHWSYAEAGTLNAAISLGYLFGALLTPRIEKAFGSQRSFLGGMLVAAAGLFAVAGFRDFPVLLALRFATGLALGPIFICGFNLAARAGVASDRSTLFSSVYGSGVGTGIILSGVLLPPILTAADRWPFGWVALAALALVGTLLAMPALRHSPATAPKTAAAGAQVALRGLSPLLVAACVYGAGYFALVTFLIAYLRLSGYPHARIVEFWITAGTVLIITTFLWGKVLARFRGGWGVALTNGILIVSALMLLVWHGEAVVVAASVLFGASVLMSAFSQFDYGRRLAPPQDWTRVTAALTASFCFGQFLGPIACGWISDAAGLRIGMLAAAGLLLACIVAALLQRDVRAQHA